MVSVVVVGPSMSGKTTLCSALAGMHDTTIPAFDETCSCYYYTTVANGREWHIWDTPSISAPHEIEHGWAGEDTLREADVVVVCHDGHHSSPMPLVRECGIDRCIIALTRGPAAAVDVSYAVEYITTTCSNGMLVPRACSRGELVACISVKAGDGMYCF
jgi:energy-coupling factor transporter ATP-binding protein EcfA2